MTQNKNSNPDFVAAQQAALIKQWVDDMATPAYVERRQALALCRRIDFRAHIKAGFTEAQALELCKA